jgi:hypothetical protein
VHLHAGSTVGDAVAAILRGLHEAGVAPEYWI